MKRSVIYCLILLTLGLGLPAHAQEISPQDSLRISLLTCSPGRAIYEYYGHSALRVQDLTSGADWVVNYGLFDFDQPHFISRFVLGRTDYIVGACPTEKFLPEYRDRGSDVTEDVLNLSQPEAHRLWEALRLNCQPENRTYHYDFFYDNCATRVREQIKAALNGKLIYTTEEQQRTLRQIVHLYSAPYAWSTFGQDLLLGAEADRSVPREVQQFAPIEMESDLVTALVRDSSGDVRPLVSQHHKLVVGQGIDTTPALPLSPMACSLILLSLVFVASVWELWKRRILWPIDLVLLALQGLAGCLICTLLFFSQHPTVDSNYLALIFNPLPLLLLPWIIKRERRGLPSQYHRWARIWLFLFICGSYFIPQYFSGEVMALALCLLLRSVVNHAVAYLNRRQAQAAETSAVQPPEAPSDQPTRS